MNALQKYKYRPVLKAEKKTLVRSFLMTEIKPQKRIFKSIH